MRERSLLLEGNCNYFLFKKIPEIYALREDGQLIYFYAMGGTATKMEDLEHDLYS